MSYRVFDAKWGNPTLGTSGGQVTWAADLSSGLQFDSGSHNAADFDNALAQAFQAWENVASIDFVQTSNFAAADITVTMGALAGNVVGNASITQFVLPGTDQIFDVDITLDSTEQWDPTTGPELNFFAVAAHEIGHAIGLRHVADTTELMNSFLAAETLGDGDTAGAQFLYGRDAGDAPQSSATGTVTGIASGGGGGGDVGGDDGGSSGGIVALVLGLVTAVFTLLSGGGGAAVAMSAFANTRPDDEDGDDAADPLGVIDDDYGDDIIAFLDLANAQAGYPEGADILVRSHMHDHGHGHDHSHAHSHCMDPACTTCGGQSHDPSTCMDPTCTMCGGENQNLADDHGFCLDPACSLCSDHLQMVDEDAVFPDDMDDEAEELSFFA